ncbi:MAG: hypothetical protein HQL54_14370 [Magnetococcales bacterium]|nr:hypothetical protein [Magnetococcales bacterium]
MSYKSRFIYAAFLIPFLTACGGGGGSSGANSVNAADTYVGVTSQVILSDENSDEYSPVVASMNNTGSALSGVEVSQNSKVSFNTIRSFSNMIVNNIGNTENSNLAGVEESNIIYGDCGGYANLSYNDNSGETTGTVTFQDFCECGETMNGIGYISVSYNETLGSANSITFISDGVASSTAGAGTSKLYGSVIYSNYRNDFKSFDALINTVSYDMSLYYWMNNVSASYDDYSTYATQTLDGLIYISDLGYAELSTIDPVKFEIVTCDTTHPYDGELLIQGRENTHARIIYDQGSFDIFGDFDGDDVEEFSEQNVSW